MKNNLQNNKPLEKKIEWSQIKKEMRVKFGNDIYESWIKKIELVNEFHNYILFSVSTRCEYSVSSEISAVPNAPGLGSETSFSIIPLFSGSSSFT